MILAYKAFNPDMTCRDFQYELGHWHEQFEPAILCRQGFHACILPQHVFRYYPTGSIFAKVLLDDIDFNIKPSNLLSDSKICGRKIYIFPYTLTYDEMYQENVNILNILSRLKGYGEGTANYFNLQRQYLNLNDVDASICCSWSCYVLDFLLNDKLSDDKTIVKDIINNIEEEQRKAGLF